MKDLVDKEDKKKIKILPMILIIMELNFLYKKKILSRLKKKATFALTCLVTKMG